MTNRIDEIKSRVAKATKGPWESGTDRAHFDAPEVIKPDGCFFVGLKAADAEFIAHSRADIPWLLAEVDRLRAALSFYTRDDVWKYNGLCDPNSANFDGIEPARRTLEDRHD